MITDTISSDIVNDHNSVCGKKTKLSLYSDFFLSSTTHLNHKLNSKVRLGFKHY